MIITRLDIFQDFMATVLDCLPEDYDDIVVRYNNDATYDPDVEETYLRVFLGPTFDESLSRSCCSAIVHCESTIEIVTPTEIGLQDALIIEQCIKNSANDWGCSTGKETPGYRMITSRDKLSVDPQFTEVYEQISSAG